MEEIRKYLWKIYWSFHKLFEKLPFRPSQNPSGDSKLPQLTQKQQEAYVSASYMCPYYNAKGVENIFKKNHNILIMFSKKLRKYLCYKDSLLYVTHTAILRTRIIETLKWLFRNRKPTHFHQETPASYR